MTKNLNKAPPKVPPIWAMLAFLAGALCSFVAAVLVFAFNGDVAVVFAVIAFVLYVAGAIGYARAPRRAPAAREQE
ncbi:hypothetical protein IMZ29_04230 [Achromobacter sp. GG226]|uniref:hypothetical protein n=1 Tax=Verticiella alkaliphila TaxID=2779529 RepID=UPI001C0E5665|nr:hypothetical protein [Verticiella sp. GG226]MBU4609781.1 hypothetical protein [Verticiella sp. GG226]